MLGMYLYMFLNLCVCRCQPSVLGVFFNFCPILLRQSLSLNMELTCWLDWLASDYFLCPATAGAAHSFDVGAGDSNLDPHTCASAALLTEPSA